MRTKLFYFDFYVAGVVLKIGGKQRKKLNIKQKTIEKVLFNYSP